MDLIYNEKVVIFFKKRFLISRERLRRKWNIPNVYSLKMFKSDDTELQNNISENSCHSDGSLTIVTTETFRQFFGCL